MVGLLTLVFAKDSLKDRIQKHNTDIVKIGMSGTLGNKGAVINRFNLDDSSIAFMNCHLEGGTDKEK